ncbi:serine/threonine-protein kinase [Streptomyces sp. NPDC057521]|uniref:serine/threonine-protein kinase n=1 Tax=Streptomyces sp. NPDC057521 TaxID=3346156 RepID=UPI0036C048C9
MREQLLGGRYRLVQQLGEGGMGQVWEARDESLCRPVAVKLISLLAGGGSRGDEARARFLREARTTARLQHPHIVTIHDLGESGPENGNAPFLVMELIRGEGLDTKLARGDVSLEEAARWGAQVCEALTEAHAAGVMHRDIKPSNVFITHTGEVKVLDFGIAKAADPYATATRLTQTGFIVGTPPYMAPEQARGYPEPSSDLYALGCLLFELITGRLPFQAPDSVGYLTAHLSQEPPAPSSVRSDIPGPWDSLVLRLLSKDPAERYKSAADASRALCQLDLAVPTKALTRQGNASPSSTTRSTSVGGLWLPGTVGLLTVVATTVMFGVPAGGLLATVCLIVLVFVRKLKPPQHHPTPEGSRIDSDKESRPTDGRSTLRTATAVTASATCFLTVPVWYAATEEALTAARITIGEGQVQMALCDSLVVMLAIGVLLVRDAVGRRLIAVGGIGLALLPGYSMFWTPWGMGVGRALLPLAAVAAALSALLAVLPSVSARRQRPL